MVNKVGRTGLFILFVLFVVIGAKMALKVADPYIRKLSASLADSIKAT